MPSNGHRAGAGALRVPSSRTARLLSELYREDGDVKMSPVGADQVGFAWSLNGVGRMAVRIPTADTELVQVVQRAASDKHLGVELEALLTHCLQVDSVEDGFAVSDILQLTLGAEPAHPERHSPHVRALRDLLAHAVWYLALSSPGGDDDVVVDWQPVVVLEDGRYHHRCTLSVLPAFRDALAEETTEVPMTVFSLAKPADYTNPEGRIPSLAARARMRLASARAPHEASRRLAARKGWRAKPGDAVDLPAREILAGLAGLNIDKIRKRGRCGAWYDALAELLPRRSRITHTATRILDTPVGFDAPPSPPVPARRGPPRASPAFG